MQHIDSQNIFFFLNLHHPKALLSQNAFFSKVIDRTVVYNGTYVCASGKRIIIHGKRDEIKHVTERTYV